MDALILSCGTGGGHNAAAAAIQEELARRGHHATILNPYDLHESRLSARIDKTYITIAQNTPRLFGAIYEAGNLYRRLPWRSPLYFANRRMAETMQAYLQSHPVDVVFMTHLFPASILTGMQDLGMPVPKTMFIATDYTCIPFTEECVCDAYVVPSKRLKKEFMSWGIPAEKIYPLGIPVSKGFRTAVSKKAAKEALGLEADKRYLLISGGSIGASKLKKALSILCELIRNTKFCLIVICGNNESLQQKLKKRYDGEAVVIGYTDQMALYLRACDLYFTKPGGLSTTEAAAAEEPLVLLPPIPGCESKNLRFFTQTGMAIPAKLSAGGLKETISWFQSEKNRRKMRQSQAKETQKDAAAKICSLAEQLIL